MTPKKAVLILLCLSLAVRLLAALPVITSGVPLVSDENGYLKRALAYRSIVGHWVRAREAPGEDLRRAYGGGWRLPLYPLTLGLALALFGKSVAAARLLVVLFSACTTPLVYLITARQATHRAGMVAALIHVFFPTFVAYSHLLWAETFYVFLLLLAVYLVSLIDREGGGRRNLLLAALAGAALGLGALTRPTMLPFLFLLPLWVAATAKGGRRLVLPLAMALSWLAVIAPWELALYRREGRLVPLTTTLGNNLYNKNAPGIPGGADPEDYARERGIDIRRAKLELALRRMAEHPGKILALGLERSFRLVWRSDTIVSRHLLRVIYPPLPLPLLGLLLAFSLTAYLLLVFFAQWGLAVSLRPAGGVGNLLLLMILANLAVVFLTIHNTRLNLPNLALMLPAAGWGFTRIGELLRPGRRWLAALLLPLPLAILSGPPQVLVGSAWYAPVTGVMHRAWGARDHLYADVVEMRSRGAAADRLTIRVSRPGAGLNRKGRAEETWAASAGNDGIRLTVFSRDAVRPALEIHSARKGASIRLEPLGLSSWRRWSPTGLEGIEYRWMPLMNSTSPFLMSLPRSFREG